MSDNVTIENYIYHIDKIKQESADVEIIEHATLLLDCSAKVYNGELPPSELVAFPDIDRDEDVYQDARALNYIKRRLCSLMGVTYV